MTPVIHDVNYSLSDIVRPHIPTMGPFFAKMGALFAKMGHFLPDYKAAILKHQAAASFYPARRVLYLKKIFLAYILKIWNSILFCFDCSDIFFFSAVKIMCVLLTSNWSEREYENRKWFI